tara:strand:- start:576 stop:875 length:300 start_codon:yes stop_codon:yes gene_type:complete
VQALNQPSHHQSLKKKNKHHKQDTIKWKINYFRRARMNNQLQIKTMDELTTTNQNCQSNLSHTRTIVVHTDQKVLNKTEFEIKELPVLRPELKITELEK